MEQNEDFIEDILKEIHLENLKKKREGEEILERLGKEGDKFGWIKLFERLR